MMRAFVLVQLPRGPRGVNAFYNYLRCFPSLEGIKRDDAEDSDPRTSILACLSCVNLSAWAAQTVSGDNHFGYLVPMQVQNIIPLIKFKHKLYIDYKYSGHT